MTVLLSEQLSAGQQELADTLRDPEVMVGKHVCHTWTVDGDKSDYDRTVLAYQENTDEFEIKCTKEAEPYFMSRSELITDIIRGDMKL